MKIHPLLLPLLAVPFLAHPACAAPELAVTDGSYNFGTVPQGKKVPHTFKIRNSGDAPLLIKKLEASCGCTAVKPSASVVPPGKKADIEVIFDSADFAGKVHKTVTLTSNAGKTPEYTFVMEGSVLEELQVTPRQVSLGPLTGGVPKQVTLSVTNNGKKPVRLTAVNVTSTSLQITPNIRKGELKPGQTGTIDLTVTAQPEAKILSGYLHILTSGARKNEITVPVYGSVQK